MTNSNLHLRQFGQPVTVLVLVTVAAWIAGLVLSPFMDIAALGGFIPARVFGHVTVVGALPVWLTPLSATLIHSGVLHIAFNMVMLLWCGRQIEPALGWKYFLLVYVVGAYAAALGQWALDPHATGPMVGASGAISAIVAVYALVFSEQSVPAIGPIPSYVVRVAWLATAWIALQTMIGLGFGMGASLIAVGAHIGGFVAGLLLARPVLRLRYRR